MKRLAILLFVTLVPATLLARDLEVFLGARGGWTFSHGFVDRFDERGFIAPYIGLALEVIDNLFVEASYGTFHKEGQVFVQYETKWSAQIAGFGARYMLPVLSWLRPYGRLTGGVLFEKYSLAGPDLEVRARQVGFEIIPLAGIEILYPTEALAADEGLFTKATFGAYFEFGFRYARPFDTGGRTPSGAFEGATGVPLEMGAFDTQGFVLGGGFLGHF